MGAMKTVRDWIVGRLAPARAARGVKDFEVADDGFVSVDTAQRLGRLGGPDDLLAANVIMSPINWILRNFTEAEATVERLADQTWTPDPDHALSRLLAAPNPFYGDGLLWKATILSWCLDGNAYWQKVRNSLGEVLGYWYLPHFLVEPKWPAGGGAFISHYEYRPAATGQAIPISVRDIVHFRNGLDPTNPRKGLSPIAPLLREVFTDQQASEFSAAILGNMGVPGGVIGPASTDALPTTEDVRAMKAYMTNFEGRRRGGWLVTGQPTDVKQFGFDPNNLNLGILRDISEERVCAALGVPAAVVGFGSGLQQTKVGATMKELRKEAWNSCIRPMQNDTAKQLTAQAVPDFVQQVRRFRVRFDASSFAASQEEEREKAVRYALLVTSGICRVDRAQQALGLEVDPTRAIYLGPAAAGTGRDPTPPAAGGDPSADDAGDDGDDLGMAKFADRIRQQLANGNGGGR